MSVSSIHERATVRGMSMLRTAMGPAIARHLADPAIVEVMLNPDGRLWIDRLSEGLGDTGDRVTPADAERIVRLVAHHVGRRCMRQHRAYRRNCQPVSGSRDCSRPS